MEITTETGQPAPNQAQPSSNEELQCQACEAPHALRFPIPLPFAVYGPHRAHQEYGDKFVADARADQLYDLMKFGMIYYDGAAQRGEGKIALNEEIPKRFPFSLPRIEEMAVKLENGTLFGDHLTWNLRPLEAHWFYDAQAHRLWLDRSSKIYLPDSHHRHRAIYLVCEKVAKGGSLFRPDQKILTLNIFRMSVEGEKALFHEFNVEGKKADKTRGYYVAPLEEDEASALGRQLEGFAPFRSNVETVRNRLSKNSTAVITFATLRDGIAENAAKISPTKVDPATSKKEVSTTAFEFYRDWFERLSAIRPELRAMALAERRTVREELLVDQAITWRAYFRLAADYFDERQKAARKGLDKAADVDAKWDGALRRLAEDYVYVDEKPGEKKWEGDLFSRANPLWKAKSVMTPTKKGKLQVNNTRDTREFVYALVKQHMGV